MPQNPPSTSVSPHHNSASYAPGIYSKSLSSKLDDFINTLMNDDQIYSYLLKLKLALHIESNSNYKNTFYGYKNKCFHFVEETLVKSIIKNSPSPT